MHSLYTVHHITEGLAEAGVPEEPVVLDRSGPHRSIQGLERLLDDALEEEEQQQRAEDEGC
ncbi:hypothetical protein EV188_1011105 [Actinomycetospora succinea]|uniref:Uncharacterized protein n=1 Tax=Actinomycetospora succinea TaxID=663603 RepID=A0A4R6VPA1_9PSEU|nr:hypothetical protein EV188_1011105 [Actinomycetospora succinea]